jgi:hypothetical protein
MADFIYDDRGTCVARIIEDEVFAEKGGNRIATIRNGNIYAMDGDLIGHLQSGGMVRGDGDAMPEAFSKLIAHSGTATE